MSGKHKKSTLEKAQSKAWKYYKSWRISGSVCPAFHGERIFVSRLGWNHLVSPRKKRTAKEKIRRFEALPLARKLIECSTTYQEHREDHGISFWALSAHMDGRKIKVILSSKNKKKYFLSVIVLK